MRGWTVVRFYYKSGCLSVSLLLPWSSPPSQCLLKGGQGGPPILATIHPTMPDLWPGDGLIELVMARI